MAAIKSSGASYLVVGKTGVGKTSLINSVAGSEVAEEGEELDRGTFNIESYEVEYDKTTIRFWDTPGLFDMTKKSLSYMEKISRKYEECDLVLYCSDITDTRVTEQDKRTIHEFTQSLGPAFWKRTCFILTYANHVENPRSNTTAEYFSNTVERLRSAYKNVLKEAGVPPKDVEQIPFIPAGYHPWSDDKEMYILHGKNWISLFWMSCFARVKQSQQVPHTVPPVRPPPAAQSRAEQSRAEQSRPTRQQCTFYTHQRDYIRQDWFECYTCWGGESSFGCCWPCALDCHRDHKLVKHHPSSESQFFCDCGSNKHQPTVCTYYSTKTEYRIQPLYRCDSCFIKPGTGVCHQCMINCHRGHKISYLGEIEGFCDCGLLDCQINCCIAEPE